MEKTTHITRYIFELWTKEQIKSVFLRLRPVYYANEHILRICDRGITRHIMERAGITCTREIKRNTIGRVTSELLKACGL